MINSIDIIFSFINLAVLIALGVYVFIRYVRPSISQEIDAEMQGIDQLKTERVHLIEKQHILEQEIVDQEKLCKELTLKINLWQQAYIKDEEARLEKSAHLRHDLERRIVQQSEQYRLEKMQKQIAENVYSTLACDLEKYFSDKQHTESYFANILKKIKSDA